MFFMKECVVNTASVAMGHKRMHLAQHNGKQSRRCTFNGCLATGNNGSVQSLVIYSINPTGAELNSI